VFALYALVLAATLIGAGLTSEPSAWEPVSLVVALTVVTVLADVAVVSARRLRRSASLVVQTTIMALLGPAPAVVVSVMSIFVIDAVLFRIDRIRTIRNLATVGVLGLVGGLLFEGLSDALGIDTQDPVYAALAVPIYMALDGEPGDGGRRASTHPSGGLGTDHQGGGPAGAAARVDGRVLAATAVLLWIQGGVDAAIGLLAVLVIVIPLTRSLMGGLRSSDDLVELQSVSDARAVEVSRLAADRERLLEEVLSAEERERARLAEALHDGPMQRLIALRQDAAEPAATPTASMLAAIDDTIVKTRAVISSLHPATSRELGFEPSLRAAIAPFPASRSVELTVHSTVDDQTLAVALLRIAQELTVNAKKHARPRRIDVRVTSEGDDIVLEVNDDGVGIDSSDAGRGVQAGHVGLAMVRRRVEDGGGEFEIETRPDGGTRSRVVLPVRRRS
jgi:signal transduction histidine kinase